MVIYLSSKNIAVMSAKPQGKKAIHAGNHALFPVPEGAVLNGVITDEESLQGAFKAVLGHFPGMSRATLVLDTTHIIYKVTALPKTSKRNTERLVKNEFMSRNMAGSEYIYDYSVLPSERLEKNRQLVLCCAIDKALVDSYRAFFNRIGIRLDKIDFSINTLLQTFYTQKSFDGTNTILCIIDHYIVSIVDFTKSGEVFFHRQRIISTETDENYFTEIGNILYSFMQSRKSAGRDKVDCLCVIDTNVRKVMEYIDIGQRLDIEVVKVGAAGVLLITGIDTDMVDSYLYNLCASSYRVGKDLNLLKFRAKKDRQKVTRAFPITFAIAAGIAVALTAWLYFTWREIEELRHETGVITQFTTSPDTAARIAEFNRLSDERERLRSELGIHSIYSELVRNTPIAASEVVLGVLNTFGPRASVREIVFSIDGSNNGLLEFGMSMENPAEISFFIAMLRETGMFRDIIYDGYLLGEGRYSFWITCVVRELKAVG